MTTIRLKHSDHFHITTTHCSQPGGKKRSFQFFPLGKQAGIRLYLFWKTFNRLIIYISFFRLECRRVWEESGLAAGPSYGYEIRSCSKLGGPRGSYEFAVEYESKPLYFNISNNHSYSRRYIFLSKNIYSPKKIHLSPILILIVHHSLKSWFTLLFNANGCFIV